MFEWIAEPSSWMALLTLTILEIVLGVDNIIFISILTGRLPEKLRPKAQMIGLSLAMLMRIVLLLAIGWVMGLTASLFAVGQYSISGRDLILLGGGLFLIAKATHEIHHNLEGPEEHVSSRVSASFGSILLQIVLLDAVFSLDSVITAVGMADEISVMIIAVMIAIGVMMAFAGVISGFVEKHPTVKMLALSFLLLIGVTLIAEGMGQHISKGYIYFAMAFSVFVEMLNLRIRAKARKPVHLRKKMA